MLCGPPHDRELTGGLYFGEKSSSEDRASDECVYTRAEIERVVRRACEFARERDSRVTSVDKANVLETSRLWRRVTQEVVDREFPDITLEHVLVDAMAMYLLSRAADFDVIVTENVFGDILTDEASMLVGHTLHLDGGFGHAAWRAVLDPIAPDESPSDEV